MDEEQVPVTPEDLSRIQAIRNYFEACPLLNGSSVGIDQLGESVKDFSVNPYLTGSIVVKRYTDGAEIRQYPFYFQSTEVYSMDALDTGENSKFYEALSQWVQEQNKRKNFPAIPGAQSIEVLSHGYLIDGGMDVAVYQIQCRVTYLVAG